jgi:hypothetical protein
VRVMEDRKESHVGLSGLIRRQVETWKVGGNCQYSYIAIHLLAVLHTVFLTLKIDSDTRIIG